MRWQLFLAGLLLGWTGVFAQKGKRQLDTVAINHWPTVAGGMISNNGKYTVHFVAPIGNPRLPQFYNQNATIKSTSSNWKYLIKGIRLDRFFFSSDSEHAIYQTGDGNLWLVNLGVNARLITTQVLEFRLLIYKSKSFLVYKTKDRKLMCFDLENGKVKHFDAVSNYAISESKGLIFVVSNVGNSAKLLSYRLGSKVEKNAGEFHEVSALLLDEESGNLGFKCGLSWYLITEDRPAPHLIRLEEGAGFKGLAFESFERFEAGGKLMIARYLGPQLTPLMETANNVKIFSYQDPVNYTEKSEASRMRGLYRAAYNLSNQKIIRLEYDGDKLKSFSSDGKKALISHVDGSSSELYWNNKASHADYILSLITGEKVIFKSSLGSILSPNGRWLLTRDSYGADFTASNLKEVTSINLTENIPIPKHDLTSWQIDDPRSSASRGLDFHSWTLDGNHAIVYDRYDIWILDPSGGELPVNLTGSVGRRSGVRFRLIHSNFRKQIKIGESVVLTAFNEKTKDNGFYSLVIGKPNSLKKLTMGAYFYHAPLQLGPSNWFTPVKAKDANVWLVPRQRADESPNLYITKNFNQFSDISQVYPERNYQWFHSELFKFKTKDGLECQAILYKPENFDPTKKYPVLFNYYQGPDSHKLHEYRAPKITDSYNFNYAMMMSRGYMICQTDTRQVTVGQTAHGLVSAIEGAADELAKRPYINSDAFGASGGSFAGYGTNCLAALSKKFKALVPISGMSDLISMYGNVPGLESELVEFRHGGMGISLGTDPELYLRNSPVAYVKSVTTPSLIVNTLWDGNVNVQQGIEWFIALRREGKPVWLLQYQEKDHGIWEAENQKDLYVRMNQFFDHYLKGTPAPVWMTRGISVNDRGTTNGFELDTEIKTPGKGLNTDEDIQKQRQYLDKKLSGN